MQSLPYPIVFHPTRTVPIRTNPLPIRPDPTRIPVPAGPAPDTSATSRVLSDATMRPTRRLVTTVTLRRGWLLETIGVRRFRLPETIWGGFLASGVRWVDNRRRVCYLWVWCWFACAGWVEWCKAVMFIKAAFVHLSLSGTSGLLSDLVYLTFSCFSYFFFPPSFKFSLTVTNNN